MIVVMIGSSNALQDVSWCDLKKAEVMLTHRAVELRAAMVVVAVNNVCQKADS